MFDQILTEIIFYQAWKENWMFTNLFLFLLLPKNLSNLDGKYLVLPSGELHIREGKTDIFKFDWILILMIIPQLDLRMDTKAINVAQNID